MHEDLDSRPGPGTTRLTPAAAGALLADFVDVLLPGNDTWPSGRTVGVQSLLARRMLEQRGRTSVSELLQALVAAGGPLAGLEESARVEVVRRFEQADAALFGWVRDTTYVAYYENPFVAEVINAQGHRYDLRPHAKGYPVAPFDLARDTPRHGRGRYVPTAEVRRVDTDALELAGERTQTWGLKR